MSPATRVIRWSATRHADGHTVWIRCRGMALRDAGGTPVRMIGDHTDITELQQAEARLERSADALRKANRELEQFAYMASHDLQQPLRTVRGFTELLRVRLDDQVDDLSARYLDQIGGAVERMQRLIDGCLAMSRLGVDGIECANVDLDIVAQCVLVGLSTMLQERGATVVLGNLGTVVGDERLVAQVLQNLVHNAVKYAASDRQPLVRITVEARAECFAISVEDNGRGIDPRVQDRIFELFQRGMPHVDPGDTSVGVGLATTRKIVRLHGGNITVASLLGVGSTFTFTLPRRP